MVAEEAFAVSVVLRAVELHMLISVTADEINLMLKCVLVHLQGLSSNCAKISVIVSVQSNHFP